MAPVREPDGRLRVRIDPYSGKLADGPNSIEEVFIDGTEPHEHTDALPSIFIQDDEGALPFGGP